MIKWQSYSTDLYSTYRIPLVCDNISLIDVLEETCQISIDSDKLD